MHPAAYRLFDFTAQLGALKQSGLYRQRKTIASAQGTRVTVNGQTTLNFCSNDYLGLANDPRVVKSFQQAAAQFGVGSGASALVCGRSTAHAALEEAVAGMTGRDRALVFSSGYLANLAIAGTLTPARSDTIFQDKLNHASLIDAAMLSRARLVRYPHCNVNILSKHLGKETTKRKLVLTDSVFSMDGDMAPLAALAQASAANQACFAVDDAHGFGVFGDKGAGVLQHLGLGQAQVPVLMATFGKAAGCAGAFVAGAGDIIEFMVQKARPYIYSTALAPALAVAATRALGLIEAEPWRRQQLAILIKRFRRGAAEAGLPIEDSASQIQPLIVGSAEKAVAMSDALLEAGILITAIRPPTVPQNSARLRITLSAGHTEADIDILLDALINCCAAGNSEVVGGV